LTALYWATKVIADETIVNVDPAAYKFAVDPDPNCHPRKLLLAFVGAAGNVTEAPLM
jgi:hypothetical protein